ncbi:MAG: chain length determinant protein EpsF [Rubrivivax sp.]|nr:chain length determinant protein EpsF [Rubrivivax sp.]
MTLTQLLSIVRARALLLLAVFAATLAAAVALSLWLPPRWTASAAVVIDVKSADPLAGANSSAMLAPSYMATQADILASDRVAQRVVRSLKLGERPELRADWLDDTGGRGNYEQWLAQRLQRRLDVRPSRESNVIELRFSSVDPSFSVAVANTFAQAYLETVLELRTEPARRYTEFFDDRSKYLREQLQQAQTRLSAFQRAKGLVGNDERLDVESARLNDLSSQWVASQGSTADVRSRQVAAGIAPESLPDVLNHPVAQGLRNELARPDARLRELAERLGDNHPSLIEARAAQAELRLKLQQETQRLSAGVGIGAILAESRESQIKGALDAQRERVLALRGDRDQWTLLQREVDLAQRAYDAVAARLTQMSLESESDVTNASLLAAAVEPARPSFPHWPLNLTLGAAAGLLLGLAAVLMREGADRRLRTPEDVARGLKLPLLGQVLPAGTGGNAAVELLRPSSRRPKSGDDAPGAALAAAEGAR